MKKNFLIGVAGALLVGGVVLLAQTYPTTEAFRPSDSFSEVKRKLVQSGVTIDQLTAAGGGSTGIVSVARGGTGATNATAAKTNLGIQFGTLTTGLDGKATNTFSTPFSAIPTLLLSVYGNPVTNSIATTKTNFVWDAGGAGLQSCNWIAIGAP